MQNAGSFFWLNGTPIYLKFKETARKKTIARKLPACPEPGNSKYATRILVFIGVLKIRATNLPASGHTVFCIFFDHPLQDTVY